MVDGRDSAWHLGLTETQRGRLWTACGQRRVDNKNSQTTPATTSTSPNTPTTGRRWRANGTSRHIRHSPGTPTTGLRERGNDTSKSTGRSGRQNAATRRNMRRDERVTAQGPVKEQQPDGMSHGGGMPQSAPGIICGEWHMNGTVGGGGGAYCFAPAAQPTPFARTTVGDVSVKRWHFTTVLTKGGGVLECQ